MIAYHAIFPLPLGIQGVLSLDAEEAFIASPEDCVCGDCGQPIPEGDAIFNTGDLDDPSCRPCGAGILATEAVRLFRSATLGRRSNEQRQEDLLEDIASTDPCHDFVSSYVWLSVQELVLGATAEPGCCEPWTHQEGTWGGPGAFKETVDGFTEIWGTSHPAVEA